MTRHRRSIRRPTERVATDQIAVQDAVTTMLDRVAVLKSGGILAGYTGWEDIAKVIVGMGAAFPAMLVERSTNPVIADRAPSIDELNMRDELNSLIGGLVDLIREAKLAEKGHQSGSTEALRQLETMQGWIDLARLAALHRAANERGTQLQWCPLHGQVAEFRPTDLCCAGCGCPVLPTDEAPQKRGRPRAYCTNGCKQRAYRCRIQQLDPKQFLDQREYEAVHPIKLAVRQANPGDINQTTVDWLDLRVSKWLPRGIPEDLEEAGGDRSPSSEVSSQARHGLDLP